MNIFKLKAKIFDLLRERELLAVQSNKIQDEINGLLRELSAVEASGKLVND